jgi:spoIIIJ-associated protein
MADVKNVVEITAQTVEQAIDEGLEALGLTRTQVQVEILEHPRPGFLGIGGRDATVRIMRIGAEAEIAAEAEAKAASQKKVEAPQAEPAQPVTQQVAAAELPVEDISNDKDAIARYAATVVEELLEKMRISAEVKAHFIDPEDDMDEEILWVDIEGRDLSILIGRRSETLNALQYIASLIVNKQVGRLIPLMVDVQGYRQRREQQIRQLALRMADQAVKTGRRQVLEPMSASERRIIHLALRSHEGVTTESVGEAPNRKVTILPKRK